MSSAAVALATHPELIYSCSYFTNKRKGTSKAPTFVTRVNAYLILNV